MTGNPKIVAEIEVRQSSKHSLCMHNAIVKLNGKPLHHKKGRKGIEESILHLYHVHHVQITDSLKEMLLKATPSENLLKNLFPCCS
jgi:hypothetical protein